LDLPSREILEEALLAYPGTVLVVSHDRFFLDRVAQRILSFEGRNLVSEVGTYSELRHAGRIMQQVEKTPAAKDPNKQRRKQEYENRRRGQRARENTQKRAKDLEEVIQKQEKDIAGLMSQMADPARALDWEGLEKLQAEKNRIEKEHEANLAEWENLVAELSGKKEQ